MRSFTNRTQWIAASVAILVAVAPLTGALGKDAASVESGAGLSTYAFKTKAGTLSVYLPSDMATGDTISGTVVAEPAGATEAERQKNSGTLQGYVVEIGKTPLEVRGGRFKYIAPAAGLVAIGLLAKAGSRRPISSANVPVGPQGAGAPGAVQLPTIGQSGRPAIIHGPFDGDAANTVATIGGRPAEILAESPRAMIVECPDEPIGATEIAVAERGAETRGRFQNLEVRLGAGKTVLNRGEKTTLDVRVRRGPMAGQTVEIISLSLVSSGPIQLEGGNVQSIPIRPEDIGADGSFAATRQIRATAPGAFDVTGTLFAQASLQDDPLVPGAIDMNGIDSVKDLLARLASMNDDEREQRLKATLKALKQRQADAADKGTEDWLGEKIKIVEGVMKILGITP